LGIFGHWYVILILIVAFLVLVAPSTLPRLGVRFGKRVRETKDASVEAAQAFKDEVTTEDQPPK